MGYDSLYEIRIANELDIKKIMSFIGSEWKTNHILSINEELFKNEFLEEDGTVNFMLAINRNTLEIESILGFLKASHKENCDLWDVMWKTKDGNMPLLGCELIKRRNELLRPRNVLGVGDNPRTAVPVLKHILKQNIYKMDHYYMLSDIKDFKIAKITNRNNKTNTLSSSDSNVIRFNSIDELCTYYSFEYDPNIVPYKDKWYLEHKYFNNKFYNYEVYGILDGKDVNAIFVLRKQEQFGRYAIRMVDYIGDQKQILKIENFIKNELKKENVEYLDFYCYGFIEKYLFEIGFNKIIDNTNIIPDYFNPFEQRNIEIWADSSCDNPLFYKADADQDRPN